MISKEQYADGYHEAWEVLYHAKREAYRQITGTRDTPEERILAFEAIRTLGSNASNPRRCESCLEDRATAIIAGRDPFEQPTNLQENRQKLTAMLRRRI